MRPPHDHTARVRWPSQRLRHEARFSGTRHTERSGTKVYGTQRGLYSVRTVGRPCLRHIRNKLTRSRLTKYSCSSRCSKQTHRPAAEKHYFSALFFSVQRLLAFARSFHTFSCMLHRTGKLTNWCIQRAAIRDGSHKSELVRDLYIVQQPSRSVEKNSKQPDHTKSNKNNTKTNKPNNPPKQKQTSNVESNRRSSPENNEEGEVITLYQLRYWYGWKQDKRETENTKNTSSYHRVSEATQHYAETRDPPSQDPRDHIEQAIKA